MNVVSEVPKFNSHWLYFGHEYLQEYFKFLLRSELTPLFVFPIHTIITSHNMIAIVIFGLCLEIVVIS